MEISCWQTPPENLTFTPGQLHLWRLPLDLPMIIVDHLKELLSADELKRAERLKIEVKRQQFVVARSCLRQILGRYLNIDPAAVEFSYGEHGKPALSDASSGLEFNLAHSGDLALLALSRCGPVGVDLESLDNSLDYTMLADRYFSTAELSELNNAPEWRQRRTFYRLWTLKESRLKLLGEGFSAGNELPLMIGIASKIQPVSRNYLGALSAIEKITSILRYQLTEA